MNQLYFKGCFNYQHIHKTRLHLVWKTRHRGTHESGVPRCRLNPCWFVIAEADITVNKMGKGWTRPDCFAPSFFPCSYIWSSSSAKPSRASKFYKWIQNGSVHSSTAPWLAHEGSTYGIHEGPSPQTLSPQALTVSTNWLIVWAQSRVGVVPPVPVVSIWNVYTHVLTFAMAYVLSDVIFWTYLTVLLVLIPTKHWWLLIGNVIVLIFCEGTNSHPYNIVPILMLT